MPEGLNSSRDVVLKSGLVLASALVAMSMGTICANAENVSPNNLLNRNSATSTLDFLNGKTLQINDSTTVDVTSGSKYSLQSPTGTSNIITKAIYDASTQTLTTTNYEMVLNLPDFGTGNTLTVDNGAGISYTINYGNDNTTSLTTIMYLGSSYDGSAGPMDDLYFANHTDKTAAYSSAVNDKVIGVFINNIKTNNSSQAAALHINKEANTVGGIFINNINEATCGGAVSVQSSKTVEHLSGLYVGNSATLPKTGGVVTGSGGAMFIPGNVNNLEGDFIANSAATYGGAIYSYGNISNLVGDFIGNKAKSGGAIYLSGSTGSQTGNIIGDFIDNVATSSGSAIYNEQNVGNIIGNFINNSGSAAIFNTSSEGKITNITGNFIKNQGGAIANIYNAALIDKIDANFIENTGSAILNDHAIINEVKGVFKNNTSSAGGAICNAVQIAFGGSPGTTIQKIGTISGEFIGNSAVQGGTTESWGGAIYNSGEIDLIKDSIFNGNYAKASSASGGALNTGVNDLTIKNSQFIDNYAETTGSGAYGGAIFTIANLTLESNNGYDFEFQGNYVQDAIGNKTYEAIYIGGTDKTLTLDAIEDSTFSIYDSIAGSNYNLVLKSTDGKGVINFINNYTDESNNEVKTLASFNNAKASVSNTTVNLDYEDGVITSYTPASLNIDSNSKVNLSLDVKSDGTADTITTTDTSAGIITVNSVNLLDTSSLSSGDTI